MKHLHRVNDAGSHFRGYENLYHWLVNLPKREGCPVTVHWGVEKHMKMDCDRLFGWFEAYVKRSSSLKQDIIELEDLKRIPDEQNAFFRNKDPSHPLIRVIVDRDAQEPSPTRNKLKASGFKLSRTYCLSSFATTSKAYTHGVIVKNHLCSSKPVSVDLTGDLYVESEQDDTPYRYGYYQEKTRANWDTDPEPLGKHEKTSLTKRQSVQGDYLPSFRLL